jgi:hypothetical protein
MWNGGGTTAAGHEPVLAVEAPYGQQPTSRRSVPRRRNHVRSRRPSPRRCVRRRDWTPMLVSLYLPRAKAPDASHSRHSCEQGRLSVLAASWRCSWLSRPVRDRSTRRARPSVETDPAFQVQPSTATTRSSPVPSQVPSSTRSQRSTPRGWLASKRAGLHSLRSDHLSISTAKPADNLGYEAD